MTLWGTLNHTETCMYNCTLPPVQPTGYADFTTEVPQPAWVHTALYVNTDFLTVTGVPLGASRLHLIGGLRFNLEPVSPC